MTDDVVLRIADVSKSFGAIQALRGVDFELRRGEVHAIAGENGAGKSTLMNIIDGILRPDAGEIFLNGEAVEITSPARAQELGIGFVPWSPLGAGFLTGKVDPSASHEAGDFRAMSPRFTPEAKAANQALVELLQRFAEAKGATAAQIALAWLLARKPFIVPIPGTRRLDRVEENLGAAEVVLTAADMSEIEAAASAIPIQGERLPPAVLQFSYR